MTEIYPIVGATIPTGSSILVTGTPVDGQVLTATGPTTADWEYPLAVVNGVVAVPTIAALLAINHSGLTDGQLINVQAYDSNGFGGGLFKWVAASTTESDGGMTFIPTSLTAVGTPYILTYSALSAVINSYIQLPNTNLVWGSTIITYDDDNKTLGTKWFHGHSVTPRHQVAQPVNNNPLIGHALGRVYGSDFRVRKLAATAVSQSCTLNYRYATGAGRWHRILSTPYVTPTMFGGKPNDGSFDNSFFICWALQYLNSQNLIKRIHFDDEYTIKGMWGETYTGIIWTGRGMELPAIKYMGDQGGGSGGVADFLKDAYIDHNNQPPSYLNNIDPYFLLDLFSTCGVQGDNATGWTFRDFCIDGNISNNMYFLPADPDNAPVGWEWDTRNESNSGRVSQALRESPTYSGFFITTQDGRYIANDTEWTMDHLHIKNMGGSCYAYANGGFAHNSHIKLGNSLSGRILYGGQGSNNDCELYGYTRTSYASPYSGKFHGWTIKNMAANPWPSNALDPTIFVLRGKDYRDQASIGNPAEERYGLQQTILDGFDWDFSPLSPTVVNAIRHTGESLRLSNGRIKGPTTGKINLLDQSSGNQSGGAAGITLRDIVVHNINDKGVKLVNAPLTGYYEHLVLDNIEIVETYSGGIEITHKDLASSDHWPLTNGLSLNMDPHPGGSVPYLKEQLIEVINSKIEVEHRFFFEVYGASNGSGQPTRIVMRNSNFNIQRNDWMIDGDTGNTPTSMPKLTFEFYDSKFNTFDPGENFRGDAIFLDRIIARSIWRGCKTPDGRVSEIDKIFTTTVANNTQRDAINALGYIDYLTDLMWTPLTYDARPISSNAITRGVTSVTLRQDPSPFNGSVTNTATSNKIRVGVGTVSTGDVLTYRITGAVAPLRTI